MSTIRVGATHHRRGSSGTAWIITVLRGRRPGLRNGHVPSEEVDRVRDRPLMTRPTLEQVKMVAGIVPDLSTRGKRDLRRRMRWCAAVEVGDLDQEGDDDEVVSMPAGPERAQL